MKDFVYKTVRTVEEAADCLAQPGTCAMAGGTDILGQLKDESIIPYPETVVNLKGIEGLKYIAEENGLHIGSMTTLTEIAENPVIQEKYQALAQAASSVASPLIRRQATIGGNICQDVRCWYYRSPDQVAGCIDCARKNGSKCYAATGLLNQHSIFGGKKICTTPCSEKCPAGVDIPAYMAQLRKGNIDGAARILLENNPIPCITSRVCTHFCQQGCNREDYDEHVGIGNVERYLGDYILENAERFMKAPEKELGRKVAVVGSGPAGLSAAFYLRKAGYGVTVYEKMAEPGGLLMYAIPAYRLPKELVRKLTNAIADMGVTFICNTDIGEETKVEMLKEENDAVFLDTGAWKPSVLGIDGEELTRFGLEFLVEVKQWMSDKPGTDVIVIGGGNVSVDVAVSAKRLGAANVTMVSLESWEELPATKEDVVQAKEEGIKLLTQWGPRRILRDGEKIIGVELKKCISLRDAQGRFSPSYDENELKIVEGDAIFLAVGQRIDLSFLGTDSELETERGRILVENETQKTNVQGIYAGGDVSTGPSTVVSAIAAGKKAARNIMNDFGENAVDERAYAGHELLQSDISSKKKTSAMKPAMRRMEDRGIDQEDNLGLSYDGVMKEAKRCMNCGCIAVNPSDILTALTALNAEIVTNRRVLSIGVFISKGLENSEIMTEIVVPAAEHSVVTSYDKFRQRNTIDFAMAALASSYKVEENVVKHAKIVLGAVAPFPIEAEKAEEFLVGNKITKEIAEKTAEIALSEAEPPEELRYKVNIARHLIKNSILRLKGI